MGLPEPLKICRVMALWASCKGFRATILHTFGVQVGDNVPNSLDEGPCGTGLANVLRLFKVLLRRRFLGFSGSGALNPAQKVSTVLGCRI